MSKRPLEGEQSEGERAGKKSKFDIGPPPTAEGVPNPSNEPDPNAPDPNAPDPNAPDANGAPSSTPGALPTSGGASGGGGGGGGGSGAPPAELKSEEIRMLIHNHEAGSIIGRSGMNVAKIRNEAGVGVSILKQVAEDCKERVMVVKGAPHSIAKAIFLIAGILADASAARERKLAGGTPLPEPTPGDNKGSASVRILCHATQVGAVIGKAGALVQDTQLQTGARVSVSTDPFPGSTEKAVTIFGTPENLVKAASIVLAQLDSQPVRPGTQVALYVPPSPSMGIGAGGMYGPPPTNPYGMPPSRSAPGGYAPYAPPPQQQQMPPQQYMGEPDPNQMYGSNPYQQPTYQQQPPQQQPLPPHPGSQGQLQKQKIVIPTASAGNVIGKGGSIITNIRNQSQCTISVAPPEANTPHERVVTITGTSGGIQTAVFLIRNIVERYEGSSPLTTTQTHY